MRENERLGGGASERRCAHVRFGANYTTTMGRVFRSPSRNNRNILLTHRYVGHARDYDNIDIFEVVVRH
jgi:hypothetical protein